MEGWDRGESLRKEREGKCNATPVCPTRHGGLRPHLEEVPRALLPLLQPETHVGGRREGLQGAQRPPGQRPQPGRAELRQR